MISNRTKARKLLAGNGMTDFVSRNREHGIWNIYPGYFPRVVCPEREKETEKGVEKRERGGREIRRSSPEESTCTRTAGREIKRASPAAH